MKTEVKSEDGSVVEVHLVEDEPSPRGTATLLIGNYDAICDLGPGALRTLGQACLKAADAIQPLASPLPEARTLAEELSRELKGALALIETERVSHREQLVRMMRKNAEHAVSGAAMASRLISNDPEAQQVLVDSIKAIRDPRAVLDRIGKGLNAPLQCGHPLDCLPAHDWDAENIQCGWCVDRTRAEKAEAVVEAVRAWFKSDEWEGSEEIEGMREALDAYDALNVETS